MRSVIILYKEQQVISGLFCPKFHLSGYIEVTALHSDWLVFTCSLRVGPADTTQDNKNTANSYSNL